MCRIYFLTNGFINNLLRILPCNKGQVVFEYKKDVSLKEASVFRVVYLSSNLICINKDGNTLAMIILIYNWNPVTDFNRLDKSSYVVFLFSIVSVCTKILKGENNVTALN